jgi:hypothetical protein
VSPLLQQSFKGLTLKYDSIKSALFLFCVSAALTGLGVGIIVPAGGNANTALYEASQRYDNTEECERNSECTVTLDLEEDMSEPVFVYYEFRNLYQNHIQFVKSRDFKQLRGEDRTKSEIITCEGVKEMSDIPHELWPPMSHLQENDIAKPCGLAARYYPQDYFEIIGEDSQNIEIESSDIAWQSDIDYVYDMPSGEEQTYWLDVEEGDI